MIVKMKKATILVQGKDAHFAISKLRKLGLLHIEHEIIPQGQELNLLQEELSLLNEAINILSMPEFYKEGKPISKQLEGGWKPAAKHIIDTYKRIDHLKEYSRRLNAQIEEWKDWGDFDPEAIKDLAAKKVFIKLYQIPVKEVSNLPEKATFVHIKNEKGMALIALVCREDIDMPFKELMLPSMSIKKLKARLEKDTRVSVELIDNLKSFTLYKKSLLNIKGELLKQQEFEQAFKGMGQQENIMYLTGYLPYDKTNRLFCTAKENAWGIYVREPEESDNVPTLVSNPRWISIINPVFKFIEIVPGYKELDISFWFLLFFSIFFGMLIADAGIGLIFAILTFVAQKKFSKKTGNKKVFILFYILSGCACLWGLATGTIFGQQWLNNFMKPLLPVLRNERFVQILCFSLGAIHLSIAHLWRAALKAPSLKSLSDIGWVSILWGGFFLAKSLVLGDMFPAFAKWFFFIGVLPVVLFSEPQKNILKAIGKGLGALALNIVNSFTDIVSYIRLFAVGLASVAVADSFNAMAMEVWGNGFIAAIAGALILIIGQALNVVLGPVAVLVHGLRLNVLEFCSHLEVRWSGHSYRPLEE